jgi:hypothetical protein
MLAFFNKIVAGARSARKAGRRPLPRSRQARPVLEALEDRLVPSTTTTPTTTTTTPTTTKTTTTKPSTTTTTPSTTHSTTTTTPSTTTTTPHTASTNSPLFTGTLTPGESITSENGRFTLLLQTDGNLVEYGSHNNAIWASGTVGKKVTDLVMQSDGNLVLYNGSTPVWATHTDGNPGAFLDLRNDGNIIITRGNVPFWSSNSTRQTSLRPGQSWTSLNGQYTLIQQNDGNLVEYNTSTGQPIWATGTNGDPVFITTMQGDGNLVEYTHNGPVWASNTSGNPHAWLNVQNNGNIVIYAGLTAIWKSHSAQ